MQNIDCSLSILAVRLAVSLFLWNCGCSQTWCMVSLLVGMLGPEDGDITLFRNVDNYLLVDTA